MLYYIVDTLFKSILCFLITRYFCTYKFINYYISTVEEVAAEFLYSTYESVLTVMAHTCQFDTDNDG